MSIGDLVKKKCVRPEYVRPEYGLVVGLEPIKGASMVHRKLTVLWDDGTQSNTWPQDVEVINEYR